MKTVVTGGAFETKGADYEFLARSLRSHGVNALTDDFGGLGDPPFLPDVTNAEVARAGGVELNALRQSKDKTLAMRVMAEGLSRIVCMKEAAAFVQRIVDAGKNERGDVLVLCHGGPIAEREDTAWILEHALEVDGFFGPLPSSGSPRRSRSPSRRAASSPFVQCVTRPRGRAATVESKSRQVSRRNQ
jgi:hypothetical protein